MLKEEVSTFIEHHPPTAKDVIFQFKNRFHNVDWLLKAAYLTELQNEYNVSSLPDKISTDVKEHLLGLETNLKEYFPPINSDREWIRNPFTFNVESETELPDSDENTTDGFSTLVVLKNKSRNKLEVELDMRIKLSSFPPNEKILVRKKQLHTSH
ncbi:hypothetical protein PR048_019215 [Dryococelus australis]|uniref:Uncharacterized protein n=1 Tax=Dryococelus australis TaxID=614101 RepID=A0ABQ9H2Z2_9NEOP|nr:hypothetical protein PR048_019215 [Dryococelus australis]